MTKSNFDTKLWSTFAKVNNFIKDTIFQEDAKERPRNFVATPANFEQKLAIIRDEVKNSSDLPIAHLYNASDVQLEFSSFDECDEFCTKFLRQLKEMSEMEKNEFIFKNFSSIVSKASNNDGEIWSPLATVVQRCIWESVFSFKNVAVLHPFDTENQLKAHLVLLFDLLKSVRVGDAAYRKLSNALMAIDKDVVRLEQTNARFRIAPGARVILDSDDCLMDFDSGNEHINCIRTVLALFCYELWNNPATYYGVEYSQGMADICWVFYSFSLSYRRIEMEDKSFLSNGSQIDKIANVFGPFFSFVDAQRAYFVTDSNMLKEDLVCLRKLIEIFDANFFEFCRQRNALNMFFCYRWLVLFFKREFISIEDNYKMWLIIFTNPYTNKWSIFVMLAIILTHSTSLMSLVGDEANSELFSAQINSEDEMDDVEIIMKFFDRLTIDKLDEILAFTEELYQKFSSIPVYLLDDDLKRLKVYDKTAAKS